MFVVVLDQLKEWGWIRKNGPIWTHFIHPRFEEVLIPFGESWYLSPDTLRDIKETICLPYFIFKDDGTDVFGREEAELEDLKPLKPVEQLIL